MTTDIRLSPWWRHAVILVLIGGFTIVVATLMELPDQSADCERRLARIGQRTSRLRERNILYRALDWVTTEGERRELLRRCLDGPRP
ncbi:MAG: hypothetical protein RML74_04945 [Acidobacteriota bacterium]|nr:hypothetical protein [Acidobacteriota bacterium]